MICGVFSPAPKTEKLSLAERISPQAASPPDCAMTFRMARTASSSLWIVVAGNIEPDVPELEAGTT